MQSHILTRDQFYPQADNLRTFFESQFANNKSTDSKRFVWDYWHVPDQYTLVRTPAYHYFPEKMYMAFHRHLLMWGRKNLGCWDISPPWLSYYVDGCKQELHSDVPHGPWAYVFSLTPWKSRHFSGGETVLLKPEVLSYWKNFGTSEGRELSSFIDRIPAPMNRLTVFDPRYPHGVREVRGTHNPLEARLVIHGWFMEPKTYKEGPLPAKASEKILNICFEQLQQHLGNFPLCQGTLSLQMTINRSGTVKSVKFATNTLTDLGGEKTSKLNRLILKIYSSAKFPTARSETQFTIPLIFS